MSHGYDGIVWFTWGGGGWRMSPKEVRIGQEGEFHIVGRVPRYEGTEWA